MATPTLSTRVSRRAMLGGGLVVLAAGTGGAAPARPLPAPPGGEGSILPSADADPDADAELLRRLAAARRRRAAFNAARLAKMRRYRAMVREPDYPVQAGAAPLTPAMRAKRCELAERTGYRAATARRDRAHEAYLAAARDAFAVPPRTLAGLYAKLRFAARASHEADNGNTDYGDNLWLDIVIADLRRLAAGPAAA